MRKVMFYLVLSLSCLVLSAQKVTRDSSLCARRTSEIVAEKLQTQLALFPQEKLYLHLDKQVYAPGEQVRFRAYLGDAASHRPVTKSGYVYVELVDREERVVSLAKVRADSLHLFHGYLLLPKTLEAGSYRVQGYTDYMRNTGNKEYLFRQTIQVLAEACPIAEQETVLLEQENYVLQVKEVSDKIAIEVTQSDHVAYPTDSLYLLLHTRGELLSWTSWKPGQELLCLDKDRLPAGVSQLLLLDGRNRLLSERLLVMRQPEKEQIKVEAERKGERMTLHFFLVDSTLIASDNYVSIAVVAGKEKVAGSSGIYSNMLFTSDLLEGEVPEDGLSVVRQSWKRYDMEAVLNNRYVVPSIPYESALSETDDRQVTTRLDEDGKQKVSSEKGFSRYQHYCSSSLSKKDIEKRKATTTDELLVRLPGMSKYRNYYRALSGGATPTGNGCMVVFNDEVMQPYFDINQIEPSAITFMGVISGPKMAMFGREGSPIVDRNNLIITPQHALVISTRSVDDSSEKRVELSEVKGRDKDTIFYWNPAVKLEKEFSISFDMPLSHSDCRVVLEDGRVVCVDAKPQEVEKTSSSSSTTYKIVYDASQKEKRKWGGFSYSYKSLFMLVDKLDYLFCDVFQQREKMSRPHVELMMAGDGTCFGVKLSVRDKYAACISEEKFRDFARRVVSEISIADYFMMEPRLKDKYCEYTFPIGYHPYWETGKGEVTIGDFWGRQILYRFDYAERIEMMKSKEASFLDLPLYRQFEEQIETIYSDVLGGYFGVIDRKLDVLVYMSDTGDILRVSLTMDEKLSDRITKEQFKQFADRIKETVTMSDYFEVKPVSEGGYSLESVWVGDKQ